LQQLLQSGTLTTAQQRRAIALLNALQNAQSGGTLTASQLRQVNSALAAAGTLATRQTAGLTTGVAGAGTSATVAGSLAGNAARQSGGFAQRSMMGAGPRGR
jgi:hypothetical protein